MLTTEARAAASARGVGDAGEASYSDAALMGTSRSASAEVQRRRDRREDARTRRATKARELLEAHNAREEQQMQALLQLAKERKRNGVL